MSTIPLRIKKIAGAMGLLGGVAAALTLAAPAASADVTSVTVSSGSSFGSSNMHGTGCEYTVTASVNSYGPVYFYDNGQFLGEAYSFGWQAQHTWTPTTTGTHVLSAWQPYGGTDMPIDLPVEVATGINLGSACVVL